MKETTDLELGVMTGGINFRNDALLLVSSQNSMESEELRLLKARTGLKRLETLIRKMYLWIMLFVTLIVG